RVLVVVGGGGSGPGRGGAGGGVVHLTIAGNLDQEGTITANGANGVANGGTGTAGGGGAAGSIRVVVAGALSGSGTFTARGGDGAVMGIVAGGGGGGGRIAIVYGGGSVGFTAARFDVSGGTAEKGTIAAPGEIGTVYTFDTSVSRAPLFHGFTFDDTDFVVSEWNADPSARHQYCAPTAATPSVTAQSITLGGT